MYKLQTQQMFLNHLRHQLCCYQCINKYMNTNLKTYMHTYLYTYVAYIQSYIYTYRYTRYPCRHTDTIHVCISIGPTCIRTAYIHIIWGLYVEKYTHRRTKTHAYTHAHTRTKLAYSRIPICNSSKLYFSAASDGVYFGAADKR